MIQTPRFSQFGSSQPAGSQAAGSQPVGSLGNGSQAISSQPALGSPQMSAAKPRAGLCSLGDLVNRLVRIYELQNELEERSISSRSSRRSPRKTKSDSTATAIVPAQRQMTFGFYECEV